MKAEVEVIDPISFGLGLIKLASGAILSFEQVRVNDEVWLPARISIRADARVAYLRKLREELDITIAITRSSRPIRELWSELNPKPLARPYTPVKGTNNSPCGHSPTKY